MTKVLHASLYGRFIEIKTSSRGRNFIERIKAPIILDAILAVDQFGHILWRNPRNKRSYVIKQTCR